MKAQVEVVDLNYEARGVARLPQVCFIEGALAGEQVVIGPTFGHRKFVQAELLEVVVASPERIQPECRYFSQCGGCQLQHLDYPAQLAFKTRILVEQLNRAGLMTLPSPEAILFHSAYAWRSRVRLQVRGQSLGFYKAKTKSLIEIAQCPIMDEHIERHWPFLRQLFARQPFKIESLEIVSSDDGRLGFLSQGQQTPSSDFLQSLNDMLGYVASFWHRTKVHQPPFCVQSPALPLFYQYQSLRFGFSPGHFTQVNRAMNRQMIAQALDWVDLAEASFVLDLYCGLGNFSLPFAALGAKVLGLEMNAASIECAAENAANNQLADRCHFQVADLSKPEGPWLAQAFQLVILDPPRSGAASVILAMDWQGVDQVLYVSCHVGTLAQDALLLSDRGFSIKRMAAMDMFAQSHHIESMVLFVKDRGN